MLITRIKANNFYGVKDTIEVKFTEGGKKEKVGYANIKQERISLISGFYGANASGKSTFLNIIDTIIRIILSRQQEYIVGPNGKNQETSIVLPNYDASMKKEMTSIEIDFIVDQNKYTYTINIVNEGKEIDYENLIKNNKSIFTRKKQGVSFTSNISIPVKNIMVPKKSSFLSILLDDTSDIAIFTDLKEILGIPELQQIRDKFCFITDKRTVQMGQDNINGLFAFAIHYLNHTSTKIRDEELYRVNSIVKYFEPSFKSLNIQSKGTEFIEYSAQYENFYKELPITELSAGTRELIAYINDILKIIKTGGVVVYDETSKYYHPDMEIAILNLFKDKSINKNNAQIFFSSHNHETFDLLQNNQAHILEKTNETITISKVSDYDVQERDNVKRIYRLGSLGGVPDTIDFNRIINNIL